MSPALATVVFWIAATCCLVAQIALLRSAIRSPMSGAVDNPVAMPRRSTEIAWTIVPAIGLVLVLGMTWRAMHAPMMSPRMHSMPASR